VASLTSLTIEIQSNDVNEKENGWMDGQVYKREWQKKIV